MAKFLSLTGAQELVTKLKAYVDEKVDAVDLSIFKVVSALPTSGIDETKIYLVPGTNTESQNIYTEYLYTGSDWEVLGEVHSEVDLSGYVNSVSASGTTPLTLSGSISGNKLTLTGSVATATSSALGVVKVTDGNGLTLSSGTIALAAASTSAAGAMSADDKSKLDGMDTSAIVSSVSASGTAPLTLSGSIASGKLTLTGSVATATTSALGAVKVTTGNGLALSSGALSMTAASTSAAGAMSSSDKSKLDSLEVMEEITTAEIDALFD